MRTLLGRINERSSTRRGCVHRLNAPRQASSETSHHSQVTVPRPEMVGPMNSRDVAEVPGPTRPDQGKASLTASPFGTLAYSAVVPPAGFEPAFPGRSQLARLVRMPDFATGALSTGRSVLRARIKRPVLPSYGSPL